VTVPQNNARTVGDINYIPVQEFALSKSLESTKVIEMIRNGFFQGRLIDDNWYVSIEELQQELNNGKVKPSVSFFHGEYGLMETFWFGFIYLILLFLIALGLIYNNVEENVFLLFVVINFCIKSILLIAIWRAANLYQGREIWRISAKSYVCLEVLVVFFNIYVFVMN